MGDQEEEPAGFAHAPRGVLGAHVVRAPRRLRHAGGEPPHPRLLRSRRPLPPPGARPEMSINEAAETWGLKCLRYEIRTSLLQKESRRPWRCRPQQSIGNVLRSSSLKALELFT